MKFSLLLPTYNRCQQLAMTLPCLEKLRYPVHDFEVIVIDNNSTDDTKKIIKDFISRTHLNVRYAFVKKQGRTFASLKGFGCAKYDKIFFIDDDIEVQPQLLRVYKQYYTKYPQTAVMGGQILASFANPTVRKKLISQYVFTKCSWIFGQVYYGKKAKFLEYPDALFAGNLSIRLPAFTSAKDIFDSFLGRLFQGQYYYAEDYELCLRLCLQQQRVLYVPELSVKNHVEPDRLNWNYVWKRQLNAGTERYIIDQRLQRFSAHQIFPHQFADLLTDLMRKNTLKDKIDWLFGCVYWWGYTQRGPRVYQALLQESGGC